VSLRIGVSCGKLGVLLPDYSIGSYALRMDQEASQWLSDVGVARVIERREQEEEQIFAYARMFSIDTGSLRHFKQQVFECIVASEQGATWAHCQM